MSYNTGQRNKDFGFSTANYTIKVAYPIVNDTPAGSISYKGYTSLADDEWLFFNNAVPAIYKAPAGLVGAWTLVRNLSSYVAGDGFQVKNGVVNAGDGQYWQYNGTNIAIIAPAGVAIGDGSVGGRTLAAPNGNDSTAINYNFNYPYGTLQGMVDNANSNDQLQFTPNAGSWSDVVIPDNKFNIEMSAQGNNTFGGDFTFNDCYYVTISGIYANDSKLVNISGNLGSIYHINAAVNNITIDNSTTSTAPLLGEVAFYWDLEIFGNISLFPVNWARQTGGANMNIEISGCYFAAPAGNTILVHSDTAHILVENCQGKPSYAFYNGASQDNIIFRPATYKLPQDVVPVDNDTITVGISVTTVELNPATALSNLTIVMQPAGAFTPLYQRVHNKSNFIINGLTLNNVIGNYPTYLMPNASIEVILGNDSNLTWTNATNNITNGVQTAVVPNNSTSITVAEGTKELILQITSGTNITALTIILPPINDLCDGVPLTITNATVGVFKLDILAITFVVSDPLTELLASNIPTSIKTGQYISIIPSVTIGKTWCAQLPQFEAQAFTPVLNFGAGGWSYSSTPTCTGRYIVSNGQLTAWINILGISGSIGAGNASTIGGLPTYPNTAGFEILESLLNNNGINIGSFTTTALTPGTLSIVNAISPVSVTSTPWRLVISYPII